MRNLTKTLAVVSLLAPASGYTLGIGDIKLHSALNQNLNAEISLAVSPGEKASDIKISLAPPDKFDDAGVPWTSFLSKIKFATVVGANGSVLVKLSSNEAVKEPFLDFLLEVNWPKGSLYREFTVLMDPPEAYKKATFPVAMSAESYAPEQDITLQRQTQERQQAETENSPGGASEYGPTGRNDTLWKIAEWTGRQEDISVEQMMLALYKENSRAFYQDNMNALLTGKMLRIPDREVILKFSRKQAVAELHRQTKAWKNRPSQTPIETVSANKNTLDNQLTLVAPVEDDKEAGAASSPVDNALQDKVAGLEKQLATMQQLIALKDQQLAALQNQSMAKTAIQPLAVQAKIAASVVQQKPAQPIVKPLVQPESEAFWDPYYLWVGGIGTGTLSLFAWLWRRNRMIDDETDIQTPFVASNMGSLSKAKETSSLSLNKNCAANDADNADDSSFPGEITFADFDTFDTDQCELDPVSEADVYMAYGRYQQAEELMRDTIKGQPGHNECKLKLLEIFYSRDNKQAFEAYASELAEAGKKEDVEFWTKVTEMGSRICPDSILFSSKADQFSAEKNAIFEKSPIAMLAEPDLVKAGPVADIKEAKFDLAAFNESFKDEADKEVSETEGGLLNFDLSSFEDDVQDDEWKHNESINFNFDSGALTDIAELDKAHEDAFWKPQQVAGKDKFESLDFDMPLAGSYGQDSDSIDRDELETKLDLAMAYIDMNDSDTAKDFAREVLEKGSPEQQMTAQVLLDGLQ